MDNLLSYFFKPQDQENPFLIPPENDNHQHQQEFRGRGHHRGHRPYRGRYHHHDHQRQRSSSSSSESEEDSPREMHRGARRFRGQRARHHHAFNRENSDSEEHKDQPELRGRGRGRWRGGRGMRGRRDHHALNRENSDGEEHKDQPELYGRGRGRGRGGRGMRGRGGYANLESRSSSESDSDENYRGEQPNIAQSEIPRGRGAYRRCRGRGRFRQNRGAFHAPVGPNFEINTDSWSTELAKHEKESENPPPANPELTLESIQKQMKKLMQEELSKIVEEQRVPAEKANQQMAEKLEMEKLKLESQFITEQISRINDLLATYVCPISMEIVKDPVIAEDGHTYEKVEIEKWLRTHDRSPMTGQHIGKKITPNFKAKTTVIELIEQKAKLEARLKKK